MKNITRIFVSMALLPLALAAPAFGQGLYATVTGTVGDSSGAVIPGVTIRATAVDTGVVTTALTNEAGVYNYRDLLPGRYTISASLPGFQTKTLTDVVLSQNASYRYNFELAVASVDTQVEVNVSADTILSAQGATVGQVLSQEKVQELPIVGNNVLDLITVMAGVENVVPTNPPSAANAFGRENTTFAGVRADNVMIVRDGINMNDNRSPNGIYSIQTINPDLVGEIRLILAPVDVELGRGNGSIQYTTRSGTNQYSGSAVWSFRNTAFDPNTWSNNRTLGNALEPNWTNTQQGTVSFGGPIIRNKTFFFGLFDFNSNRTRSTDNFIVYTPCARLGIVRYYNLWNSTNASGTEVGVTTPNANPVIRGVDLAGNPVLPSGPPSGTAPGPYDNTLQKRSLFGPMQSMPTRNDCSDAPINMTTLVPNGVSVTGAPGAIDGGWDQYRRQLDPGGYISRHLAYIPLPNNYEVGDGLNTAGFRWLRRSRGIDNLFGSGEATGERKQFNVKIDHNFTSNHKANVNWSYERVVSDDVFHAFPDSFSNSNFRRPLVITAGFTSTLSPSLLNEARFGYRLQDLNVIAPMALPEYDADLAALFPPPVNGIEVMPFFGFIAPAGSPCPPHYGARPPTNAPAPNEAIGCNIAPTSRGKTPTWTFSDTISWTKGTHAFRFNGEFRLNSSKQEAPGTVDFVGTTTYASATLGSFGSTAPGTSGVNDFSNSNSRPTTDPNNLRGLANNTRTSSHTLMNFLAGSLSGLAHQYYIDSPDVSSPPQISDWKDFRNNEFITTTVKQTEFSAWVKDEWKITRNLTITPGLRWDYTGVPYLENGTTVGLIDGGGAAFGISGRDFTGWMNPGVRADMTTFEFVGPNSPNPNKSAYPDIWHNFGPSFAFAWTLPWFGEGKTTIRGGYQITYSTGSPNPGQGRFSSYAQALGGAPGRTLLANANTQTGIYLDLTTAGNTLNPNNLSAVLPVVPSVAPLQPQLTTGPRNQALSVFDPNYENPYVQNLTLSVTRTINRNVTLDVRYIGTLSRKSYTTQNLNINNFRDNGLLAALDAVRRGDDANTGLLDEMFNGINLCTSAAVPSTGTCAPGTYGPINGTTQRAAVQIRAGALPGTGFPVTASTTSLVNADYNTLAGVIANYNYNWGSAADPHVCAVNCGLPDPNPTNNRVGAALRQNGFADNFIVTNPQFSNVTFYNNMGYNNYHSLQAQVSVRPIQGFSGSVTYNWSKNLGLVTGGYFDPTNRAQDYTNVGNNPGHSLRTNGTIELPLGPNKLFFGNTSGWVARVIERWQLGLIYNLNSGAPVSITAASMLYGNGVPDVVNPIDFNKLKGVRWGIRNTPTSPFLEGRYFDNGDVFTIVDDPICFGATNAQNLSGLNPATGPRTLRCTLNALAMVVDPETPNSYAETDINGNPTGRTLLMLLQHAQPGRKGNLGNNTVTGLGNWRFDANLGKTFQISESKSLQVRFDAQNVLNHPQPGNPSLNINSNNPFGQITTKTGGRSLQGQLRLSF